jgi:hypothetical protein
MPSRRGCPATAWGAVRLGARLKARPWEVGRLRHDACGGGGHEPWPDRGATAALGRETRAQTRRHPEGTGVGRWRRSGRRGDFGRKRIDGRCRAGRSPRRRGRHDPARGGDAQEAFDRPAGRIRNTGRAPPIEDEAVAGRSRPTAGFWSGAEGQDGNAVRAYLRASGDVASVGMRFGRIPRGRRKRHQIRGAKRKTPGKASPSNSLRGRSQWVPSGPR